MIGLTEQEREAVCEAVEVMLARPDSDDLCGTIERIIAAREARVAEEIAQAIEAERSIAFAVEQGRGWSHAITRAARIAREIGGGS